MLGLNQHGRPGITHSIHPQEPPITPELIGILAVGATLIGVAATMIGLLRADMATFRTEMRADSKALRAELRSDNQRLRAEVNAGLADVRKDVQVLTERVSRLEGVIEGLFAPRADRERHDDAA
ncbi:MAG: hypothetical protein OXO54_07700 [Chloroflexota bacterium]|nr:hypothetical protein [Chloroflexota bacterium]